jgi:photosystem II stability/assembly factor-like uncharacterized protein
MSLSGTVWAPMGPSPINQGGRRDNGLVSAIAINPNNPNVIYIGTAGGGAWRSADGGTTWKPIFDRQLSLSIGEPGGMAIDPSNTDTIYIGTSGRISQQAPAGLFKSTDGGASWIRLGSGFPTGNTGNATQFVPVDINITIVDPANSNIVYLGCATGVFRSVDGGRNWTLGTNAGGDARSLVLDPSSPTGSRILYAGISSRGVFRSNDGGQNWTQILSAATAVVANALCPTPPCIPPRSLGKFIVALAPPVSPPNPAGAQVLYVTMQGRPVNLPPLPTDAPDPVGLFMSTDQGANWTQRPATGMPLRTQGGYSFHMAVDPGSPGNGTNDIIYFGAVGQARSTDSGANFTALTGLHADTHAWAFVPQPSPSPSIVFSGNDGGLFRSTDGGMNWTPLNSGGLQTSLFYNIDVRPDATASITLGALQDNAVETTAGGTGLGWIATSGGDGWDVAYDATTASQVYSSSGFYSPPCTRVFRSTNDGTSFPTEITPWGTASDAGCYLAPVGTDPSTGGIVYVSGSQNLWQSRNNGGTWRVLSAFPSTGNVDVARTNGNNVVIAVGTQVFVSTNALAATVGPPSGVTFTNITRNLPTGRNVARAVFDPVDPMVIYAVLGGFDGPGGAGHVFRTTVGGTAWTNISPALNLPFNAIALDGAETPTAIYVGTDYGVLRSVDAGASWSVLDDIRMPRVPVVDLVLNQQTGILRAATYGRGVFQFVRPTGPAIAVNLENFLFFTDVCTGPAFLTLQIFNVGTSDLVISSVQRLMGSSGIFVLPLPGTPVVIGAGEELDFTIAFVPTTPGTGELAIIRISSNDPAAPVVDLLAFGSAGLPALETVIAENGNFGDVCLGSFVDEEIIINNRGACPLSISGISSSSAEFAVPTVTTYPLVVSVGGNIGIPLRFRPTSLGPKSATITINSNAGAHTVPVSGDAPPGKIAVTGSTKFDCVECGRQAEKTISICNVGDCPLRVTEVAFKHKEKRKKKCGQFKLIRNPFPATLRPGSCLSVVIRYKAKCACPKECELVVISDDPATPIKCLEVTARVCCPKCGPCDPCGCCGTGCRRCSGYGSGGSHGCGCACHDAKKSFMGSAPS